MPLKCYYFMHVLIALVNSEERFNWKFNALWTKSKCELQMLVYIKVKQNSAFLLDNTS